jgi:hypothetical protein
VVCGLAVAERRQVGVLAVRRVEVQLEAQFISACAGHPVEVEWLGLWSNTWLDQTTLLDGEFINVH